MSLLRTLKSKIMPGRVRAIDREVGEEIAFHIEMRTAANIKAGMGAREARRDAERRFGDTRAVRAAGREMLADVPAGNGDALQGGIGAWFEGWLQDIRVGTRMLLRSRAATAAAVISLGLGIGANSATFSVVYGVLFRDLPFAESDRLLFVDVFNPDRGDGDRPLTWLDIQVMRDLDHFEGVDAFGTRSFTVTGSEHPERVAGAAVTPGMFDLLGVPPAIGRTFRAEEAAAAGFEPVAIISDSLWNSMFGADPDITRRTVHLNGRELDIVGVMPPGFRFPEREHLWVPLGTNDPTNHTSRTVLGVARLSEGASLASVREQLAAWTEQAAREFPETHAGWDVRAQYFRDGFIDAAGRQTMYLLLAAVGLVLLLACTNVANLLLARATGLQRDLVVRSALGASRTRLARQMLAQSVLLGLAGGMLGYVIAYVWVGSMARVIPEEMAFWVHIAVDRTALLYTVLIAVGTGLLFGALPALQASRAGLEVVNSGGRAVAGGGANGRLRAVLVSVEVALSVVLLISATLMVRSFLELQVADPGFDEENLLSLRIVQAGDQYDDPLVRAQYYQQVTERLEALPGVVAAAATSAVPADDGGGAIDVLPAGAAENDRLYATAVVSTQGLFDALGVEPLRGRDFTVSEALDAGADVILVGERLAETLWPGTDPLGRAVNLPDVGVFRVIGVVPDFQYEEFGEGGAATRLQLHLPYARSGRRGMALMVRTSADPATVTSQVRAELGRLDPTLAPYDIMTMTERRAFTTWPQRVFGNSFAVFGAIAFLLAFCGIYGVIAYSVVQQTREIGVRIALGARPVDVLGRVVGGALKMTGIGVLVGLAMAFAFTQALSGVLYGVSITDPMLYGSVVGLILLAATLAAYLPARRAAAIEPTEALRIE